jgi:vancomycin resistance protein YoaR
MTFLISVFLLKTFIYNRFAPGTEIGGVDVSKETPSSAVEILKEAVEEYSKNPFKVTLDKTTKEISMSDLGITILVDESVAKAKEKNKTKTNLFAYIIPGKEKIPTSLIISIDKKKATDKLNQEFSLNPLKAENAWYKFDYYGKLQITDGKNGLEINFQELAENIKIAAENLQGHSVEMTLTNVAPVITKSDLEEQKTEMLKSLKHTIVFSHPEYRNRWSLSVIQHLDWVKFVAKQKILFEPTQKSFEITKLPKLATAGFKTKTYIAIELDKTKFNEFVDQKMSKYLDAPVENVKIYTDKDGKIIIEGRGDNGKQIQRDLLEKAADMAIMNKIETVPIPVLEIEPTITVSEDLKKLGIKDRLSIGHTTYYGSPLNRMYNINVGAKKLNATLVKPDETFSFNKIIGHVNGATGYLMELVIKPEGTIPEFGGGLCQISTTTYRGALFAGLPIEERYQHSYAVSYYSQVLGHGLDATVYETGPDLKFKNNTGNHLLIQAYVKNKYELYIIIYGTNDGRTVEMDGPYISNKTNPTEVIYKEVADLPVGVQKKVELGHVGFNALWYRYVTMPNGEKIKDEIISKYQTMPAKIEVGTKPADSSPAPAAAPPSAN